MKWKTIVNTGAERGFVVGKARVAITIGTPVMWTMDGTDDGLSLSKPSATNAMLVVGLAHTTMAAGVKGLVQVYGLDDDAHVLRIASASDSAFSIGAQLDIFSASECLSYIKNACAALNVNSAGGAPFFIMAQSHAAAGASSASSSTFKVFLRCL